MYLFDAALIASTLSSGAENVCSLCSTTVLYTTISLCTLRRQSFRSTKTIVVGQRFCDRAYKHQRSYFQVCKTSSSERKYSKDTNDSARHPTTKLSTSTLDGHPAQKACAPIPSRGAPPLHAILYIYAMRS